MCGIFGAVGNSINPDSWRPVIADGLKAMAHRGPDQSGLWPASGAAKSGAVLGHVRLSIIDLSGGRQPMANESGDLVLVYNGELYNFLELKKRLEGLGYRFRDKSDTEVVLRAYEAWGERCVREFRGMFALAIWDGRAGRLFLARDHFGKKPLFYMRQQDALIFSSEIKALLRIPGVSFPFNYAAVPDYLTYRYVPGPATLFQGINKLGPGGYLIFENGSLTEEAFFTPPDRAAGHGKSSVDRPVEAFLEKLDECVRIRMISDVPFGAFLSGGIDSSTVVGLMCRHSSQPIKTFSVGFRETRYSELDYARTVAGHFSTDHHELVVSSDDLISRLPQLIRFRDAPVSEPSDIPIYLLAREARKTVKMVLTGEGSDEILGGYPKHVFERYARPYQMLPEVVRNGLFEPLVRALPYRFRRAKTAIINLGLSSAEERLPRWFGALSTREQSALLADPPPAAGAATRGSREPLRADPGNSALRRILYFDQTSWLPDNLLERGDRMTMAASLEARMPFMDYQLAAFMSALPDRYRVRGFRTKWILREALKQMLPPDILDRPKVGFRLPVNEWFQKGMREYLYDHLTGSGCLTGGFYRQEGLRKILTDHTSGRQNHEKILWTLINLELWCREYQRWLST